MKPQRNHLGIGYAHPDAERAKSIAGQTDQTHVKADLGKAPLTKRAFTTAPEIHSGMNAKSKSGVHFGGLSGQDLSRYDADPGDDPLSALPSGKRLTAVMPVPGQRSRVNDPLAGGEPGQVHATAMLNKDQLLRNSQQLAAKVLLEAADNSTLQDRMALGIGTLPQSVTEE
jgi:hypothetical protein